MMTSGTSYDPEVSECGKYRQISAINPAYSRPKRAGRGMHPVIYASVEITEKAREECRILLDVSSRLLVSLDDSYLLM